MSDILNEFGKEIGLIHEVMVTGRKLGADRKFWAKLAHHQELFEKILRFANSNHGVGYPIEVDYDNVSFEKLIVAASFDDVQHIENGNYQFSVSKVGKAFPVIELYSIDTLTNHEDNEKLLDDLGYRHADIVELLVFAATHPKVVEANRSIYALGSLTEKCLLVGKACAWVGHGHYKNKNKPNEKHPPRRCLGVSHGGSLETGTYAVVKKEFTAAEGPTRLLAS